MLVRQYLKAWWTSIKHRPVSFTQPYSYLWHLTYTGSPLSIELVELTRARLREPDALLDEDEPWFKLILRPVELFNHIKRYHCAGSLFFMVTILQFIVISYLGFKALFHGFITGDDWALAQYYADRYFPRIYGSNPDAHDLDSFFISCITYIFVRRSLRLYALIKNSIINRNGYRKIMTSQLNLTSAAAFTVPLSRFEDLMQHMYNHKKECDKDPQKRREHLTFGGEVEDLVDKGDLFECVYFRNPIDFSPCYGEFAINLGPETKPSWAKDWFVAPPMPRIDPTGFLLLTIVGSLVLPLMMFVAAILNLSVIIHELCVIADENNEGGCLAQIPVFLSSLSRFISVFDMIALVIIQLPLQIETAKFTSDCSTFISRINKLIAAFREDVDSCYKYASIAAGSLDKSSTVITSEDWEELNRATWFHIQLIRSIYQEFRDLTTDHTAFLNILLLYGGLLWSLSVTEILKSHSLFRRMILGTFVFSSACEICITIILCVMAEKKVSI